MPSFSSIDTMDAPAPVVAAPTNETASKTLGPKPKRPLSAFNLFYRFKRQKVLDAISSSANIEKEDIARLVNASPGLEARPDDEPAIKSNGEEARALDDDRRKAIRVELEGNLLPRDTRDRQHRTDQSAMNGSMSFLELGKLMNASWKECDEFAKKVFHELAEEGRELYRARIKEYNDKAESLGLNPDGTDKAAKAPMVKVEGTSKSKTTSSKKDGKKSKKKSAKKSKNSKSPSPELRDDVPEDGQGNLVKSEPPIAHHAGHQQGNELQNFLSKNRNEPIAAGDHNNAMMMRMTTHDNLRTVSKDHQEMYHHPSHHGHMHHQMQQYPSNANDGEHGLRARVKELEGQLATERLLARIRELEGELSRQKSVEVDLRAQLDVLTRSGNAGTHHSNAAGVPPVPTYPPPPPVHHHHSRGAMPQMGGGPMGSSAAQRDGLWSLASASMIHPSVRTQEREAMLHRMAGMQQQHHGMMSGNMAPVPPPRPSSAEGGAPSTTGTIRPRDSQLVNRKSSNKKQRRSVA